MDLIHRATICGVARWAYLSYNFGATGLLSLQFGCYRLTRLLPLRNVSSESSISTSSCMDIEEINRSRQNSGLSVGKAAFFMVTQMAGAGFLALPRAFADVGWLAIVMLFLFCLSSGFAATRLGLSWVMLEERYPEYQNPVRRPYPEIASKALGPVGKYVALIAILLCNIGSSTVYIILVSQMLNSIFPQLSICEYMLIVAAVLIPFTWLGTPKDFWQATVFAVVSTVLAVIIIVVEIILEFGVVETYPAPEHTNPTFPSFFLGFGAILFSFGGLPVFPTIQNDMKNRSHFWRSVLVAYPSIISMYFPVAILGYVFIGASVNSNIFLSLKPSPVLSVAKVFQIFNLMGSSLITLSPIFQSLEDALNAPRTFGIHRMVIRSCLILVEVVIALAFPDFGLIVNLIGGSGMAILCFILPPLTFIKLVDDKSDASWPQRSIPTWMRCYMWEIFGVGIVGGLATTITSLYALLSPESLDRSCFAQFSTGG